MDNYLIDLHNLIDTDKRINFIEDNYFGERQYEERGNIIRTLTEEMEERKTEERLVNNDMISKQAIINLMQKRVCELMEIDSRMPLSKGFRDWYDEGLITGRYTELEIWMDKISKK